MDILKKTDTKFFPASPVEADQPWDTNVPDSM